MAAASLSSETLKLLSDDHLASIAAGEVEVEIVEFKATSLAALRDQRAKMRQKGEKTARMDAMIELVERYMREPLIALVPVTESS